MTLPRLPRALQGFTIVQITDVHVGPTVGPEFVRDVVDRVNDLAADLVAITGDLVDGPVSIFARGVAPLARLRSRHGTFFVTGNHEYYAGVKDWLPVLRDQGLRVLRNERVEIHHAGGVLDLAGVDDHEHRPDLPRAVEGRDPARPLVLLAHQPRQVHVAKRHGVDLQLSGHTHGGQIWPWHEIVKLQQGGLLAGHYRIDDTQLYVSRGTGYWGPAVRVGAPAEISRIVLQCA